MRTSLFFKRKEERMRIMLLVFALLLVSGSGMLFAKGGSSKRQRTHVVHRGGVAPVKGWGAKRWVNEHVDPSHPPTMKVIATGVASHYSDRLQGRKTASGIRFDQNEFMCAHPTEAFGKFLIVENVKTGANVEVMCVDRGPAAWTGRVIDLSRRAMAKIGLTRRGTGLVRIRVVDADPRSLEGVTRPVAEPARMIASNDLGAVATIPVQSEVAPIYVDLPDRR